MGFYKDRWIAHYERSLADREFRGFSKKAAEQLAQDDADIATREEQAAAIDYARMIAKEGNQ